MQATSRNAEPASFGHEEPNHVCVRGECVYYRRQCTKDGEASRCFFELDVQYPSYRHIEIRLDADNDKALQMALSQVAYAAYLDAGDGSPFALSVLDGTDSGTPPASTK